MTPKTGLPKHWTNAGNAVLNAQVVNAKASEAIDINVKSKNNRPKISVGYFVMQAANNRDSLN